MSTATTVPQAEIVRGILLTVLAMALLALSDMFIKLSAQQMSVGQVMVCINLGGGLLFCAMAALGRIRLVGREMFHPMVLWRNLFEIIGAVGLVTGLAYVPLSIMAAIMQTAPLVVTIGATVILKEHVGPRRWLAVGVGLVGMLLVIRPGTEDFSASALFAVVGVVGLAMRDLITRLVPREIHAVSLSAWGFSAPIPAGLVLIWLSGEPLVTSGPAYWLVFGAVLVTTAGYLAMTNAMRLAPASVVSPFRCTRLVFTMGVGVMLFGERPDAMTLTGAAIILAAGLYTFVRERQIQRRRRR